MKILKSNYLILLDTISNKIKTSESEANPTEWLFKNDLRTPFFMLQAISRITYGVYEFKKIKKLNKQFKLIEDSLGRIDYYNQCLEVCKENNKSIEIQDSYSEKMTNEIQELTEVLKNKNWLNHKIIKKIIKYLNKKKWYKENDEKIKIKQFYLKEINKIRVEIESENYSFDDIEHNIHELRRNLRWLSIYVKATNGVFKLIELKRDPSLSRKYFTKEILNSPYIQFDNNLNINKNIQVDKNSFLALSWLINKYGNLKDEGLLILEFNNISNTKSIVDEDKIKQILKDAKSIIEQFNQDKILQNLLVEVGI